jgi:hypothetical protein
MGFGEFSQTLFNNLASVGGSIKVTYNFSGGGSKTLTSITGRTTFSQGNAVTGETSLLESFDFIFNATDLGVAPSRGDTIDYNGVNYTVMVEGANAMYRYTDQSKATIRVHTKEIGL